MSALGGEFNESTQHLLILPDEEVCGWRGMHVRGEDAAAFIIDCLARSRPAGYSSYGYEVYLPNVIADYLREVERPPGHESTWRSGPRAEPLSPLFYEAAWEHIGAMSRHTAERRRSPRSKRIPRSAGLCGSRNLPPTIGSS
jgi:hypothetical protein